MFRDLTEPYTMDGVPSEHEQLPGWLRPHAGEHRWPVAVAIVAAIVLQLATPASFAFAPTWVLPGIEAALLAWLVLANPFRLNRESGVLRVAALTLVGVASLAVAWSTGRLVVTLSAAGSLAPGGVLLAGAAIWLTNVIVCAVWFWELDRGGPACRANGRREYPDFLFPQMTERGLAPADWRPEFGDYLYVAFTNATAFSPTDTLPLTRLAKLGMAIESAVSATIVIVVIAHAVNAMV